jgi:hypothetical protein
MRADCLLVVAALAVTAQAQVPTLRERVARERADISSTRNVEFPARSIAHVLKQTDLVVRGILGPPVAHLSADGHDIFTTYDLNAPQVLFSAKVAEVSRPGLSVTAIRLRQPGGRLQIDGFTATVRYDNAPSLSVGMDVVLLLRDDRGVYEAAGGAGIFQVRDDTIVPLGNHPADHRRFSGMRSDAFISEIVALRGGAK